MKKFLLFVFIIIHSYAIDNKETFYNFIIKDDFDVFLEGGNSLLFSDKEKFLATTAGNILKEFKKNELKATKHFSNKDVFVKGKAENIRKTATGNAQIIFLNSQMSLEYFSATLDKSETEKVADLDDNKPIVVACKSFRKTTMNMPMMYDCVMADTYLENFKEALIKEENSFLSAYYEVAKIATDDFKGIDLKTEKGKSKMVKSMKNINKLSKEKQEKIKAIKEKLKN